MDAKAHTNVATLPYPCSSTYQSMLNSLARLVSPTRAFASRHASWLFVASGTYFSGLWFHEEVATLLLVEGGSMRPTLNPDPSYTDDGEQNDICILWKWGYSPRRGDVVCMWAPKRKGAIVKRVIGIPGDEVTPRPSGLLKSEAMVVPVGHIWVEGDNESNSVDSNSFGVVPVGNVIGKVSRVALPQNSSQAGRTWLTLTPRIPEPERLKINSAFNTGNTELLLTKMDRRI